eukprot:SAG22_NODE_8119_length_681_cov_1.441581_2_plen_138_part_00
MFAPPRSPVPARRSVTAGCLACFEALLAAPDGPDAEAAQDAVGVAVRTKARSFCCASTVFLSKTVPFHAVPLDQGGVEAVAAALQLWPALWPALRCSAARCLWYLSRSAGNKVRAAVGRSLPMPAIEIPMVFLQLPA